MYQTNLTNLPFIDYEKIFDSIYRYFTTTDPSTWHETFLTFVVYFKFLSTVATLLLAIGIFYAVTKYVQIRHREALALNAQYSQAYEAPKAETKLNERWEQILTHIESANSNDWKVAIIEADILLGEMLDELGYQGASIGEKLKRVQKGDLATLDQAWEAHKVRNAIAHQGPDFVINQREAKRVINMYQAVQTEVRTKK